jgi:hypothetical protein
MTADKLLIIIPYSLRSCFAPTNIFAKVRCTRRKLLSNDLRRSAFVCLKSAVSVSIKDLYSGSQKDEV